VTAALQSELPRFLSTGHPLRCGSLEASTLVTGMGMRRARRATIAAIDRERPELLLHIGFCGAVQDGLKPGDLLLASEVVGDNQALDLRSVAIPEAREVAAGLAMHVGRLQTRRWPTVSRRRVCPGALAVDMESFAIAQVGIERGLRTVVVKAVSDLVPKRLGPGVLRQLIGLTTGHRQAKDSLEQYVRQLLNALSADPGDVRWPSGSADNDTEAADIA